MELKEEYRVEWRVELGVEWIRVESRVWRMQNGERRVECGEWRTEYVRHVFCVRVVHDALSTYLHSGSWLSVSLH